MNMEAPGYGAESWERAKQRSRLLDGISELLNQVAQEWHTADKLYTGGAYGDRLNELELLSPRGELIDVQWGRSDPEIRSVLHADGTKRQNVPMARDRAAWLLRDHSEKYDNSVIVDLLRARDAFNTSIQITNAQGARRTLLIHASAEVLWYDETTGIARECDDEFHTLEWIAGVLAISKHPGFMREDPWEPRGQIGGDPTTG